MNDAGLHHQGSLEGQDDEREGLHVQRSRVEGTAERRNHGEPSGEAENEALPPYALRCRMGAAVAEDNEHHEEAGPLTHEEANDEVRQTKGTHDAIHN